MNLEACMPWICRRLIFHEGVRLKPYRCPAGKLTIGAGRNLEDNPLTPEEKKACGNIWQGITMNAAYMLLRNDIRKCDDSLKKNVKCYKELDEERQYALIDLCFNLGLTRLLKFRKMLKAMEEKNFKLAEKECLDSNYARQLVNRSKRISHLIGTGEWLV